MKKYFLTLTLGILVSVTAIGCAIDNWAREKGGETDIYRSDAGIGMSGHKNLGNFSSGECKAVYGDFLNSLSSSGNREVLDFASQ